MAATRRDLEVDFTYSFVFRFERNFGFESAKDWMKANWNLTFVIVAFYLLLVFWGNHWMKSRQAFELRKPLAIWNMLLAIFSIAGACRCLPEITYSWKTHGFHHTVCNKHPYFDNQVTQFWAWIFSLSKVLELGDTAFIILRKRRLLFLHWYHHITVLVFTWFTWKHQVAVTRWFVAMNLIAHSAMYSYYSLKAMKVFIPRLISMSITTIQLLQMVVGLFVNVWALFSLIRKEKCSASFENIQFSLLMYDKFNWMKSYWKLSIIFVAVYLLLILLGRCWMSSRQSFDLRKPLFVWNSMLAAFSIVGTYRLYPEMISVWKTGGFHHTICKNQTYYTDPVTGFWCWLYVVSKMLELGDTMFIVLRKKPLVFLHWYHHAQLVLYCWYTYQHEVLAAARWFVLMNYAVHSVMYSYYALRAIQVVVPYPVAMAVTTAQIVQMLGGMLINYSVYSVMIRGEECGNSFRNLMTNFIMYLVFFFLFVQIFYNAYIRKLKKPLIVDNVFNLDYNFEDKHNWMKSHWRLSIIFTAIYLFLIFFGRRWMSTRPRLDLQKTLIAWNLMLATFSIAGTYHLLPEMISVWKTGGFHHTVCKNQTYFTDPTSGLWSWLFVMAKVLEFGDTIFIILPMKIAVPKPIAITITTMQILQMIISMFVNCYVYTSMKRGEECDNSFWNIQAYVRMSEKPIYLNSTKQAAMNQFSFEKNFDLDGKMLWLDNYWTLSFLFVTIYLILIYLGQRWMQTRPAYELRTTLAVWNWSLALFSIMGTSRILPQILNQVEEFGFEHTVCSPIFGKDNLIIPFWSWCFIMSKVIELGDTAFIILRKQKLIFLHWYHHVTVLVFSWYTTQQLFPIAVWFCLMNFAVHSVLYSYFALRAMKFKIPRPVAMTITIAQLLQMAGGLYVNWSAYSAISSGRHCDSKIGIIKISMFMYASYGLFPIAHVWGRLFGLSKVVELGDTAFIVLRKKKLTYWKVTFLFVVIYLLLIYFSQRWMQTRRAFKLRASLAVWNWSLALFSIFGVYRFLPAIISEWQTYGFEYTVCDNTEAVTNPMISFWACLFGFSKVVELGDTAFIVLRKKKLVFLHWYHHVTVLVYTWYSIQQCTPTCKWFILMNLMVHSVMYSYFALTAMKFKIPRSVAMAITTAQLLQMVGGLYVNWRAYGVIAGGRHCDTITWNIQMSLIMYASYWLLFAVLEELIVIKIFLKNSAEVDKASRWQYSVTVWYC
uniref:Elongation of very long chain fatty acids protein n=1 Tax=Strigamia maritima TaxID=126957 RepID=T1IU17_STRMM